MLRVSTKTTRWHKSSLLSFMVTCVLLPFINQMDIFIFSVEHLVRHSDIFCQTFIKNIRLSDRSDKFRQHWEKNDVLVKITHWHLWNITTLRLMLSSACMSVHLSMCLTLSVCVCHTSLSADEVFLALKPSSFTCNLLPIKLIGIGMRIDQPYVLIFPVL